MNKFLTIFILLLSTIGLAQDFKIDHSYTTGNPPFAVGDTITVKYEMIDYNSNASVTKFLQFDYQYNNKLLAKIDHTWVLSSNTSAAKSLTHWDGYKYKVLDTYDADNLTDQYIYGWAQRTSVSGDTNSYPTNNDWSVERITVQENSTAIAYGTTILNVRYRIKDRQGTGYDDYTHLTDFNWVKAHNGTDSANDDLHEVGWYNGTVNIDNQGDTTGVDSGAVTINLNTAAKADHAADYTYEIYAASGVNGKTGDAIKTGNFDANGQIITGASDLEIGKSYYLKIGLSENADWLDDVLTVTDVYIIFAQAIGAGTGPSGGDTNTFDYSIQYLLAELNNSGNVNFDDSYEALGHIQGVEGLSEWFTSDTNGAKNVWGTTAQLGVSTNDYYFGQDFIFTVTDANKTFNFGHAFQGDPDFSHSFTPTNSGAAISGTQGQGGFKESVTRNALKDPIQANLDITTSLVDEKVHLVIDLQEEGLVGTQFNIKYDKTILTLDDVIFDTGNDMTNVSTHFGDKSAVRIGSIDPDGGSAIKLGNAYKLIFTPGVSITNTAGLVSFEFTEGVKADGTKVKFIIK